jgi:tryptophan-rich sensory protein
MGALSLAGWIALSLAAGAAGAVASVDAREFYAALERPAWAPPGWLFGPVWTVLYVLMGVAAWLAWRAPPTPPRRTGLVLFVLQLVLNALWSWIFFYWRSGAWAFAEIVVLWALIVAVIVCFAKVRPLAAWLLAPYLGWVTFAMVLTWFVWQRNPGQL